MNGEFVKTCPDSPNCVSSYETRPSHQVKPLNMRGEPSGQKERLKSILLAMPRTKIVSEEEFFLHATFTSLLFRFIDDVFFIFEPDASIIHIKSASRVGWSDLGANRRRVETIRSKWNDPS